MFSSWIPLIWWSFHLTSACFGPDPKGLSKGLAAFVSEGQIDSTLFKWHLCICPLKYSGLKKGALMPLRGPWAAAWGMQQATTVKCWGAMAGWTVWCVAVYWSCTWPLPLLELFLSKEITVFGVFAERKSLSLLTHAAQTDWCIL